VETGEIEASPTADIDPSVVHFLAGGNIPPVPNTPPTPTPVARQPILPDKSFMIEPSIGTSFATPALIATVRVIFGLNNNFFLDGGLDFGCLIFNDEERKYAEIFSLESYYSWYPFIHAGCFLPISEDVVGWHFGVGGGYMITNYKFSDGMANINMPTLDLTTGFIFINRINYSYSLRTNFKGVNHKLSLGYIHRFF
jgi:hypothetical protein